MKKLFFLIALLGSMTAANAQNEFQLQHNQNACDTIGIYNSGDTISIDVYEEDIYEMDYQVLVFLQVKNNTDQAANLTLTTHITTGNNAFRVQSVCSTVCAEGETCPPFDVAANSVSDNVFPEYIVTPTAATEGTTGVAELILNNTADHSELLTTYLKMTYHPMTNSIRDTRPVSIKVYPNPTTAQLTVDTQADEVVLTDLAGREVMRQRVNGNTRLNVESLTPGTYVLTTLSGNHATGTQKVIVR